MRGGMALIAAVACGGVVQVEADMDMNDSAIVTFYDDFIDEPPRLFPPWPPATWPPAQHLRAQCSGPSVSQRAAARLRARRR